MLRKFGDRPSAYVLLGLAIGVVVMLAVETLWPRDNDPTGFWEKARTDPTAAFTLALVVFTGVLAAVSTVQIYFLTRADETARAAATVAEKTLIAANRPWLKVELRVATDIVMDTNGLCFTLDYVVNNIGNSPASDVMVFPHVITPSLRFQFDPTKAFNPSNKLDELIDSRKNLPIVKASFGKLIFPKDSEIFRITVTLTRQEIIYATEAMPALYPCIVGFVQYYSALDDKVHYTGFIADISRARSIFMSAPTDRPPSVIFADDTFPISASEIKLSSSSILYRTYAD